MDFDLTEEQRLLKESVDRFVEDAYGDFEKRKAYQREPHGWSAALWDAKAAPTYPCLIDEAHDEQPTAARINEVRSDSIASSGGMPGAAVVVHATLNRPPSTAAKTAAVLGNSATTGSHRPIASGRGTPSVCTTRRSSQLRTAAVTSRPPHASAVASVTASAGLSSAEVV